MFYRTAISIIAAFAVYAHALGVVITEFHRDPAAGNKNAIPGGYSHEFVELANFGSDTLFLSGLFLTNGKVCDSVTLFGAPIRGHEECVFDAAFIPPGGIAVVLPQNYPSALETAPATTFPIAPGTILFTVNHKTLGGGVANDDGIALFKGTRSQIDSLIDIAADPDFFISSPLSGKIVLSPKQSKGSSVVPVSLLLGERRYAVSPKEPLSPGRFETFSDGLYMEYTADMVSGIVRCTVAGIFVGGEVSGASWRLYSRMSGAPGGATEIDKGIFNQLSKRQISIHHGSSVGQLQKINIQGGSSIEQQRQFLFTFDITPQERQYIFEVKFGGGESISFPLDLSGFWANAGTLVITELYPKGGSAAAGQPEWFEIKNASAADVNLNGWMFGNSKDTAVISAADFILPSGQYAAVCKDTALMLQRYRAVPNMVKPARWHTLNSYNDTLHIWSPNGVEADMAVYRSAWFGGWTAQSLERVFGGGSGSDSASWALCGRPTPGLPGRANRWRAIQSPSVDIGPIPFSPNGDGIDDALSIKMNIPPNYRATIKIFSFEGKLLRTFKGEQETVLWDGKTDKGRPAAPGAIYIVTEFTSGKTRKLIKKNGILWR